ncbi:MAG: ATP-binding protein [Gemmatimonadota bacterium]|nr:ATP-binding protein [Gemmatimonadota bacterium]
MQVIQVHSRPLWQLYAEALMSCLVAVILTWLLRDALTGTRFLLFWAMSVAVAWRCGAGPVAIAALVGAIGSDFVLARAAGTPFEITTIELFSMAVYVLSSIGLGFTVDHLRRAQLRVAQATNGMTEAMVVFDARWHLRFVNEAGIALIHRVGLTQGDFKGREIWDVATGAPGTVFEAETRRAQREGVIVSYEAQLPNVDIWVRVRCVPTGDGGVALFIRDVSATQRAEMERRRTEERYRALAEASTVMVFGSDPTGRVSEMPEWREVTGQSTAELRTSGLSDAIHPDDRDRAAADWQSALAAGTPYTTEYRLQQRDGTYRWYRSRAVPIHENGAIREWVGVFDDIEDEHLARQRHAAVDNALGVLGTSLDYEWNLAAVTRLVVPTLADYCSIDLVDEAGELRRVSSTHADPEKEEILRDLWRKYPYRKDDRGVPTVVRSGATQMTPLLNIGEVVAYAQTDEQRDMLLALAPRSFLSVPMISHGHVFGALALVYSSSGRIYGPEERAAVEQIAARAATAIENSRLFSAAQAASRAKSEFLATMSHELRTPLNAIAGYADLMAMGVRGPVTPDQLRDLTRIRQNQKHLLEIITNILNFSRIESGHIRYEIGPCALGEVLERMEGVIEPQARAREIVYEYLAVSPTIAVAADREKLEQILINLLGNAVKFTPRGGHITLSATEVTGRVRIEVRDTGMGIKSELLDSIFEPFVQLESAFTRTAEGTGLGLAISRELARGMGGELRATSAPGKGSVFCLELPIAE